MGQYESLEEGNRKDVQEITGLKTTSPNTVPLLKSFDAV